VIKGRKGKVAVSVLIGLVGAAVALILFLFLTEIFTGVTQKAFHKVQCQIEWLGEAYFKKSPSCEASYINIKLDKRGKEEEGPEADSLLDTGKETSVTYYLSDYKKEAVKKIKKWHGDDDYALTASHFRENYETKYDEKDTILLEYGIDKIMAEEAKNCWDIMWKGKFPFFDRWWSLIDCESKKCENADTAWEWLTSHAKIWDYKVKGPPVFCFLCSRITFDEEVANKFNGKEEIKSLAEWMGSTPVSEYGKVVSYAEYTQDDVHKGLWEASGERYNYYVREPPYAVSIIYARVNQDVLMHFIQTMKDLRKIPQFGKLALNMLGFNFNIPEDEIEGDLNALFVVPYAQAAEKCTYMVG